MSRRVLNFLETEEHVTLLIARALYRPMAFMSLKTEESDLPCV